MRLSFDQVRDSGCGIYAVWHNFPENEEIILRQSAWRLLRSTTPDSGNILQEIIKNRSRKREMSRPGFELRIVAAVIQF
jgi:hypothetical protein